MNGFTDTLHSLNSVSGTTLKSLLQCSDHSHVLFLVNTKSFILQNIPGHNRVLTHSLLLTRCLSLASTWTSVFFPFQKWNHAYKNHRILKYLLNSHFCPKVFSQEAGQYYLWTLPLCYMAVVLLKSTSKGKCPFMMQHTPIAQGGWGRGRPGHTAQRDGALATDSVPW